LGLVAKVIPKGAVNVQCITKMTNYVDDDSETREKAKMIKAVRYKWTSRGIYTRSYTVKKQSVRFETLINNENYHKTLSNNKGGVYETLKKSNNEIRKSLNPVGIE
jgi:hypothetical protein